MDNLMLLSETSSHSTSEAAESVPRVVQTASSGSLKLIGLTLVVMMCVLVLLMIVLICMEVRQDTLRKMISSIAKRLERMEKRMREISSEGICYVNSSTVEKDTTENYDSAAASGTREDPIVARTTLEEIRTKPTREENSFTDDRPVVPSCDLFTPPERSYPVCGLRVNASSHYNQNSPVSFNEVPIQEAVFILYSNMTVIPNDRQFNIYNNASYYTNHDFTMIFDFIDRGI